MAYAIIAMMNWNGAGSIVAGAECLSPAASSSLRIAWKLCENHRRQLSGHHAVMYTLAGLAQDLRQLTARRPPCPPAPPPARRTARRTTNRARCRTRTRTRPPACSTASCPAACSCSGMTRHGKAGSRHRRTRRPRTSCRARSSRRPRPPTTTARSDRPSAHRNTASHRPDRPRRPASRNTRSVPRRFRR